MRRIALPFQFIEGSGPYLGALMKKGTAPREGVSLWILLVVAFKVKQRLSGGWCFGIQCDGIFQTE